MVRKPYFSAPKGRASKRIPTPITIWRWLSTYLAKCCRLPEAQSKPCRYSMRLISALRSSRRHVPVEARKGWHPPASLDKAIAFATWAGSTMQQRPTKRPSVAPSNAVTTGMSPSTKASLGPPACCNTASRLSGYRDEELQGAVMLQTALLTLKYIFRDDLRERLPEILGLLRDLEQSSSGLDYVITLLRYLAQGPSTERLNADELRRVATAVLSNEGELMTTIAEQWVQEGIEKGIPMGIEKGILVGESLLLRRLLTRRFGPVPGWVEAKLAVAEPAQLETWGERVLDAPSLEGVFAQP